MLSKRLNVRNATARGNVQMINRVMWEAEQELIKAGPPRNIAQGILWERALKGRRFDEKIYKGKDGKLRGDYEGNS